ncbi:unnamed protein product [Paramecium sonneborni]|uniref:50S ribosomal protein L20 n=1 Tax=Paramecium sonneborni TaxID=65129 RepID=A0A8S1MHC0_9CILI|nr:unnamed protein product [Paramecium sonneborni]
MANWSLKKYLELAKGFQGRARNTSKIMMNRVQKSLQYAYVSRRLRPRILRREWIQAINAGVREHRISYSQFIFGLNHSNIQLDRKILANLAINEPFSFKTVVDEVKIQNSIKEKPYDQVSLDQAFERGLIANNVTQTWFKKGIKEGHKLYGLKRELTPEELKKFEKGE